MLDNRLLLHCNCSFLRQLPSSLCPTVETVDAGEVGFDKVDLQVLHEAPLILFPYFCICANTERQMFKLFEKPRLRLETSKFDEKHG